LVWWLVFDLVWAACKGAGRGPPVTRTGKSEGWYIVPPPDFFLMGPAVEWCGPAG